MGRKKISVIEAARRTVERIWEAEDADLATPRVRGGFEKIATAFLEAHAALVLVDRYFMACAEKWKASNDKPLSKSLGACVPDDATLGRMCDEAGDAVGAFLKRVGR